MVTSLRYSCVLPTTIVLAAIALFADPAAAGDNGSKGTARNRLACRLASYREFQHAAWQHLPTIGFKYVFMNVPPAAEVDALKQQLATHGLAVAVLRGDADLSRAESVDHLAGQLATCEELGVKYMFLSPKHPEVSKRVACERLRQVGEIARKHGVVVALETHPDLGTNGDAHLETMKEINHPNIRVNFDVANITYYNQGTDAATELRKIIDYVATVELKDHNGQYKTWNFPALGQGVVDIPAVLSILEEHSYQGPITIEVEGIEGVPWDECQTKKAIAESAAYVRSLGEFE